MVFDLAMTAVPYRNRESYEGRKDSAAAHDVKRGAAAEPVVVHAGEALSCLGARNRSRFARVTDEEVIMKIVDLRTIRAEVPLEKPIRTAIHQFRSLGALLVTLDSGDGLIGESYLFANGTPQLKAMEEMVLSLKPMIVGADAGFSEALWRQMWRAINFYGHKGISVFAL